MAAVDPGDVEALTDGDVETVVPIVTVLAKSYTRGQGFDAGEPNQEIAAVIVTASARLAGNGPQLRRKRVDDVEDDYSPLSSSFGWSLAEQAVLNRYRVQAM